MDRPLHIHTPLLYSPRLSAHSGTEVWLKMESAQPTGSFKLRGMGHACAVLARRGARGFVSSSGGNAGIAAAYAGQALGLPVTVVVPETTTAHARALIRDQGAEVLVAGESWQEANARAEALAGPDRPLLHPFDDPLLWAGHATLIDEVVDAGCKPDAVVASVGGGGLLCGLIEGLERRACHSTIIACETAGAASLNAALEAGRPVTLGDITSIATSLGAKRVCDHLVELSREQPLESQVVDDADAIDACVRFLDDHRTLVEPACGAALALAYATDQPLARFDKVLVVVCGGATLPLDELLAAQASANKPE